MLKDTQTQTRWGMRKRTKYPHTHTHTHKHQITAESGKKIGTADNATAMERTYISIGVQSAQTTSNDDEQGTQIRTQTRGEYSRICVCVCAKSKNGLAVASNFIHLLCFCITHCELIHLCTIMCTQITLTTLIINHPNILFFSPIFVFQRRRSATRCYSTFVHRRVLNTFLHPLVFVSLFVCPSSLSASFLHLSLGSVLTPFCAAPHSLLSSSQSHSPSLSPFSSFHFQFLHLLLVKFYYFDSGCMFCVSLSPYPQPGKLSSRCYHRCRHRSATSERLFAHMSTFEGKKVRSD